MIYCPKCKNMFMSGNPKKNRGGYIEEECGECPT